MIRMLSKLLILIVCFINPLLSNGSNSLPKLVGSEGDNKNVVFFWFQPEKIWETVIFDKLKNDLAGILDSNGYKMSIANGYTWTDEYSTIRDNLIEPTRDELLVLAKSFAVANCFAEVYAVLGHGFYNSFYPQDKGLAIAYYKPPSINNNIDNRYLIMQQLLGKPYANCFDQGEITYPPAYSQGKDEINAIILKTESLKTYPDFLLSSNLANNGIGFLLNCHSNTFFTDFLGCPTLHIFDVADEKKAQELAETFIGAMKGLIGELEGNNYYFNTAELQKQPFLLKVLQSEKLTDNNVCLMRSPRIEEVIIYNADNENDIYYHYVYVGKDKYNPTEPYPGKEILKVKNGDLSLETMIKAGFLKKPVPSWDKAKIKLVFSKSKNNRIGDKEKVSVKIRFWVSEQSGYKQYLLDVIKSEDQTNNTSPTWIGVIDILNNKELSKAIQSKNVGANLLVSYIDPQKSNKTWFLDVNGDGKWTDKTNEDGEIIDGKYYDNNHWFRVAANKIYSLWITPGRSLQGDYNSSVASSERTIEGYGYFNYLNKEHIAGKNLKINLLMDVGGLEEDGDKNKSAEEKEKDILKQVEEIGKSVLLKYDGSPMQALVTGVKRSDDGKDKFIISYAFQNPGSDGRHLLEAMFDKDDEKNKPVYFSIGRYASHSLTVDTMSPNLSLFEEKRTCFDISGWLVSGKVYDTGTNPSGIGILATWTDLAGYIGFPATGILDQFKNIPLHYDISVKDFQLGQNA